ncbi:MAG: hypothetical protein JEZ14_22115, partial [Marinilabiliaceae bacterium]|nr:hypothetical protein [Marinilabiliaceae bacterium]
MFKKLTAGMLLAVMAAACGPSPKQAEATPGKHKAVVYQVFTRLFGNSNETNKH